MDWLVPVTTVVTIRRSPTAVFVMATGEALGSDTNEPTKLNELSPDAPVVVEVVARVVEVVAWVVEVVEAVVEAVAAVVVGARVVEVVAEVVVVVPG